jgi:beta-glucanase (GH16 family)
MYLYGSGNSNTDDEIDIELVTNNMQAGQPMSVELNRYSAGSQDSGDGGLVALPTGFNPLALNTWTIVWNPDYIDYYVDGYLLQQVTTRIPTGPMSANLSAWAPNSNWNVAYNPSLQPSTTLAGNQAFNAYVTNVTVSSSETPEPTTWVLMFTGLAAMVWARKRQTV